MYSSISVDDFMENYHNVNIIDLRSFEKYNTNHIDGSINIPYEKLLVDPSKYLDKGEKYYLYCQKGLSSSNVCSILSKLGYNVVNIKGGYESWLLK